ncbi:MAG: aldose 1-epimerase family protein [Planctomycetaceae bacterium]
MPTNFESVHWHEELDHRSVSPELQGTEWSIRSGTLKGGLSEGVEIVELNNGSLNVSVLPTRGMGIWNARLGNIPVGWKSPVERPVHPAYVNLESRNGLGWLDGFNELICRCGLSFNGPPGTDDGNPSPIESHITLHGKIANLPASHVVTRVDAKQRLLSVTGVVDESTLFGPSLRLTSSVFTELGSNRFSIRDTISNHGAGPAEVQLLYHTNVGRPFLEGGSEFVCPAEIVVPRDPRAAEDVNSWSSYLAPTAGYAEQVYFFRMAADENGRTLALLRNKAGDRGFCVRYSVKQLPCFSQWKCTQPEAAGYVTGLEPGMNYPNFKSFERHHGRVHKLASGDDITIELDFDIYDSASQVQAAEAEIAELQQSAPRIEPHPTSPFC